MKIKITPPLVRYEKNPIITPDDMPFPCAAVFNSGAVMFNGKITLLLRVRDLIAENKVHIATSDNGYNFSVNPDPINYPLRDIEKKYGVNRFDIRITPIDDTFYVCHAAWLYGFGCTIAMAKTDDLVNFEPLPHLSLPTNRNAVLFPEKINGKYARLERPQDIDGSGKIWIGYSENLTHWGEYEPIPVPDAPWHNRKTGAGAIPIKTNEGWLIIYHGTSMIPSSENYFLGAMLLDSENPSEVIAAPREYILAPEKDYEYMGLVPNVVFTAGAVEADDGRLLIYYGGADTRMCVAVSSIEKLTQFCLDNA